eukprot:4368621-Pleurochrysis_carterae.AAC.3
MKVGSWRKCSDTSSLASSHGGASSALCTSYMHVTFGCRRSSRTRTVEPERWREKMMNLTVFLASVSSRSGAAGLWLSSVSASVAKRNGCLRLEVPIECKLPPLPRSAK